MTPTRIELAQERARRLYKSPGFSRAYVNGVRAALDGKPKDECPYTLDPAKTWRRSFRLAWLRGWHSAGETPDA